MGLGLVGPRVQGECGCVGAWAYQPVCVGVPKVSLGGGTRTVGLTSGPGERAWVVLLSLRWFDLDWPLSD